MKYWRGSIFPIITAIVMALTIIPFARTNGALAAEQSEQTDADGPGALDPVTADEESAAERIPRSDRRVKEIFGEREVRLVSATPVLIKKGESPEKIDVQQRVNEVVLFRPEPEAGARALVNLAQNSVANVERLDSRQVAFTPDDLNDAFQLALRDPQVQKPLGSEAQSDSCSMP
jgi:Cu2+-containing amine oxidase